MQNLTQPTLLLKPFAENGQRNSIPENATGTNQASLDEGFPPVTGQNPRDGGIPPTRLDFNGLGHLTTTYDYFYQAGGCFTFNQVVSDAIGGYPLNARLWYLDANGESSVLRSTKANNTDNFLNDPSVIGDSWVYDVATTTYVKDEINEIRTNCITEIPQDIKLELNNRILTLKAGSKVYDGSGNVINITNDKSLSSISSSVRRSGVMAFYDTQNTSLYYFNDTQMFSGATQPTSSEIGQYAVWYDTTNKVLKRTVDDGATWISGVSLPLGSFTTENNTIISLDQVFNGFGYIGSTVFALPGVKGLIPNGRNEDGTLRNIEFTLSSVKTDTRTNDTANTLVLSGNGISQQRFPDSWNYDAEKNIVYSVAQNAQRNYCVVGEVSSESTKITSFQPKNTFRAVDYFDAVLNYGDQDIGGNKNFTGNLSVKNNFSDTSVYMKNTNDDITQIIATEQTRAFRSIDKNGKIIGDVRFQSNGAGQRKTSLIAKNAVSGTEVTGTLSVYVNNNGSVGAEAPTPSSATDNSAKIATTSWVNKACKNGKLMGVPNYSAPVTVSNTGTYTAPSNGYLFITVRGGGTETSLTINSVEVAFGWLTNTGVGYRASIPMSIGDIITWDSDRIVGTTIFVSAK